MISSYVIFGCVWLVFMLSLAGAAYADRSRSAVKVFVVLALSSVVWPLAIVLGIFVAFRKLIQYGWS